MKDPYDLKKRAEAVFGERVKKGFEKGRIYIRLRRYFFKEAVLRECSECLGYIRNIAVLGRSSDISAQMLLEELSDISDKLSPVFGEMSRHLSVNDKKSAADCFRLGTGIEISSGMGEFLAGWDDIKPSEILETVEAYQSLLRAERQTAIRKRNETISDLVYVPVVINCMLILLDFIYIAFFVRQQEYLSVIL